MIPTVPFIAIDRRTAWVRCTLLLAVLAGLIASTPVWRNAREFPLLPMADWFPILPAPWDVALLGSMILSLLAAFWFYRPAVMTFLAASLFAYCGDQNRGQPWLYLYWVMLLLTLMPKPAALAGCRWALAAVYLWGGIQKCNPRYFEKIPEWFVSPAAGWHLPGLVMDAMRWAVATAPLLEMGIAIGLWFKLTRRPALAAVVMLHGFALIFLGPLGHNYNWVVWPWNLAMISLALALFPAPGSREAGSAGIRESWSAVAGSRLALAVIVTFAVLPALSFFGKWDSAFSFALYSESSANANLFVTQRFVDRLPARLRTYVDPFPGFDPQVQGPFIFNSGPWGLDELGVPPLSEPRAFRSVFKALRPYAPEPADLRMVVGERGGRVWFYQGDDSWPLQAK